MQAVKKITDLRIEHTPETRKLTFSDLIDAYCAVKHPNEPRDHRLKKWRSGFGSRDAWSVGHDELMAALEKLEDADYAASTVNREATDIASIYSWAIKNRRRTGCPTDFVNPVRGRAKLPEQMRTVQASETEIKQMLALAKLSKYPRMYGLLLMALTSGARKGEIKRMTWSNCDFANGVAEVGIDGKSGQYRTLMLPPAVVAEIRTYKQAGDELVFRSKSCGYSPFDERREWSNIRAAIGRPDLHFHDLRHIATARLLRSGASLHIVSKVLGHTDARMVSRRYGSLESGTLLSAVSEAAKGLA